MSRSRVLEPRAPLPARYVLLALVMLATALALGWVVFQLASSLHERAVAPPEVLLSPIKPGRVLGAPLNLIVALDESPGAALADPAARRQAELGLVARWMAESPVNADDTMAVGYFAGGSGRTAGPVPVSRRDELLGSIRDTGPVGGGPNAAAALEWSNTVCEATTDRYNVAVILLADQRGDPDRAARAVESSKCDAIHVVALGSAAPAISSSFTALPVAGISVLEEVAPGTIARSIAEVVLETAGQTTTGSNLVTVR